METKHWQDVLTGLAGICLIIFPFVVSFPSDAALPTTWMMANFVVCGAIAVLLAISAIAYFRPWEEWILMVVGLWLIASPWLVGFAGTGLASWTAIVAGVVIAALAGWTLYDDDAATSV